MKLTIENIAPYLPYGLKCNTKRGFLNLHSLHNNAEHACWFTMDILSDNESERDNFKNFNGEPPLGKGYKLTKIKPVFRKLDLTKPIIENGVEIIPFTELAKIATDVTDLESNTIYYNEKLKQLEITGSKGAKAAFAFDNMDNSFVLLMNGKTISCNNQLQLFQWLFKHKYDVFGLIDAGLALDADNLPTGDPYNN